MPLISDFLLADSVPGARSFLFLSVIICSGIGKAAQSGIDSLSQSRPLTMSAGTQKRTVGFTLLNPTDTAVTFTNLLNQDRSVTNQIYLNGSGVATGDVDGDGWCDIYFCGLDGASVLYRNLGNWKFADITKEAGVSCRGLAATGAVLADIDGDGDLDLIVNSIAGGTHIFRNDGKAHFTESTVLNAGRGGMSLALADIDGGGPLDLYICNYRTTTLRDQPGTKFRIGMVNGEPTVALVNGQPVTTPDLEGRYSYHRAGGIVEHGEADILFHNDGKGNFTPISFTSGAFVDEDGKPLLTPPFDWGLSVAFRDLNGDGAPDIYVCNDFESPDRIWINNGRGQFRAVPRLALRNTSKFSMGIDVADINRDGHDDLLVLDMLSRDHVTRLTRADKASGSTGFELIQNRPQFSRNTLQLNRGDGTYAEVAFLAGLEATEWSWTPIFLDVDLDGYEDVLITTGHGRDDLDIDNAMRIERAKHAQKMAPADELALRRSTPPLPGRKLAFRNGQDLRFKEMGWEWGFDQEGIGHGMALADLDNDGDLDVVVNNLNGAAGLYRNESGAPRVAVRLKGLGPNTRGIGAKIWLYGGAVPMQSQEMICGGRYLSSDDPMRVFAAGSLTNEMRLEVQWRSGRRSVVKGVGANRIYEIEEKTGEDSRHEMPEVVEPPLFEEVSERIGHEHHDEDFDDFGRQPLLPRKLSQLGPGVSWTDLDGDGWEDLVIGSGKGGKLAAYRNDGQGGFRRMTNGALEQIVRRDQTAVVGLGGGKVLVGVANYEEGLTEGGSVEEYDLEKGTRVERIEGIASSTGPVILGDLDGDGDLDLFVGGRVIAGKYPEGAHSRIYRKEGGQWVLDTKNTQTLEGAGMVSGAVWSDLDGDGYPELILACEWGPVRVYQNERGQLKEATRELGMEGYKGWWNGVTTGDLDGDGKLDIIASNWGQNTKYEQHRQKPLKLYYGDFAGSGSPQIIESWFEPKMNKDAPIRLFDVMGKAIPSLRERFSTHSSYARAGVDEVLGQDFGKAKMLEATWLETTLFLNRGNHFEARVLPIEAQFAPAFAVCVGDCDGDGNEDVFLSQNFFDVGWETSRFDAGRALWLEGDGKGNFQALSGDKSGLKIYGEQRGAGLCDYDGDGKLDLVVTQNNAETRLFHNARGRPGLRVKVEGPPGNRFGAGTVLRLRYKDRFGPAHEIHAGSGYWSADSPVSILGKSGEPSGIWARWPGGHEANYALPLSASEIELHISGELKLMR